MLSSLQQAAPTAGSSRDTHNDARARMQAAIERSSRAAPEGRVRVIWALRDPALAVEFMPLLARTPDVRATVHLTRTTPGQLAELSLAGDRTVSVGRPNIHDLVSAEARRLVARGIGADTATVFACGPAPLVHSARCAAYTYGM